MGEIPMEFFFLIQFTIFSIVIVDRSKKINKINKINSPIGYGIFPTRIGTIHSTYCVVSWKLGDRYVKKSTEKCFN